MERRRGANLRRRFEIPPRRHKNDHHRAGIEIESSAAGKNFVRRKPVCGKRAEGDKAVHRKAQPANFINGILEKGVTD